MTILKYQRHVVSALGFLDGATPLLFLSAAVSPVVYICSYGLAFLVVIPLVCYFSGLLGFTSALKARNSWDGRSGSLWTARRGYAAGSSYIVGYCYLFGVVLGWTGATDTNHELSGCLAMVAYSQIPIVLLFCGLFFGELVTAPIERLAGLPHEPVFRDGDSVPRQTKLGTRGFLLGGLTILPAFIVSDFDFAIGQAWKPFGQTPHSTLAPGRDIVVEASRMLVLLAVIWLHQALLILLISRLRAIRAGVKVASPAYLRILCLLSACAIAVLLCAFVGISRSTP